MKRTFFHFSLSAVVILSMAACSKNSTVSPQKVATISVIAGSSTSGSADGTGTAATFYGPYGLVLTPSGTLYISDENSALLRQIDAAADVSTLAGSTYGDADGGGAAAEFFSPAGMVLDAAGNIYIADEINNRIRKVTPSGDVTTIAGSTSGYADGVGSSAQFDGPVGLAIDAAGNLYVADSFNQRIRKVAPDGTVTTIAGSGTPGAGNGGYADGPATTAARFSSPCGLAIDNSGNIWVTDFENFRIREISPSGIVTTVAGSGDGEADGTGTNAEFGGPTGIALDASGNAYVTDYLGTLRKVTPGGVVTTVAGGSGTPTYGELNQPAGLALDNAGNIYIADYGANEIKKVSFQ